MLAIRVDRVAAFLYTINPLQVHATGNEQGAEFLIKKHEEWDDVIHDYEVAHGMFQQSDLLQKSHLLRTARTLLAACREKRATMNTADRRMLEHVVAQFAAEVGVPYQPDLLDAEPKHAG